MLGSQPNDLHGCFPTAGGGYRARERIGDDHQELEIPGTRHHRGRGGGGGGRGLGGGGRVGGRGAAGGGGSPPKSGPPRAAGAGAFRDPPKPVSLTFASWVGTDPTMKKLAADFH